MCDHGFIGACAKCDGCGQQPEADDGMLVTWEIGLLFEDGRREPHYSSQVTDESASAEVAVERWVLHTTSLGYGWPSNVARIFATRYISTALDRTGVGRGG